MPLQARAFKRAGKEICLGVFLQEVELPFKSANSSGGGHVDERGVLLLFKSCYICQAWEVRNQQLERGAEFDLGWYWSPV